VRAAARLRILALVDPALATLHRAVKGKGVPNAVAIAAAREILDRAGLTAEKPSEQSAAPVAIQVIVQDVRETAR
jgi:hypothetical protein